MPSKSPDKSICAESDGDDFSSDASSSSMSSIFALFFFVGELLALLVVDMSSPRSVEHRFTR